MKKPKVLLITDTLAPYRIPLFNLIKECKTFDFTVLSLTKNMLGRKWRLDEDSIKFRYQTLNSIQIPLPNRLPLVFNSGLINILKNVNPDAIIVTGYYQPDFLKCLLFAKKKGIKIICWIESHLRSIRSHNFVSYYYRKWFINKCDAFIVPGMRSKEFLLKLKIKDNKIYIAPNAVDNDFYYVDIDNKYTVRNRISGSRKYAKRNFLYVGRLIKEKGIETLLRAYKDANLEDKAGLILVGDGKDEIYFKRLSNNLKLKNVFFEGFKQAKQLKDYYRLADIFIFPSLRDEWGLVLNEACIAGLPIIASDEAGASDTLVSSRNGWIFQKNNITGLRECLKNILLPEGELIKRGFESQKNAIGHSPQKCADSIIESVNSSLNKKKTMLSSAGVLYSHAIAKTLYKSDQLDNIFTPVFPKDTIPKHYSKRIAYPHIFFKPIIKIARKYKNLSNIFVNQETLVFDKCVSRYLKNIKYDILHGFSGSCFYSMSEAKKQGKICIVDQHDVYYKMSDPLIEDELKKNPNNLSSISYWPPHKGYHKRVDEELKIADYAFVPSTFSLKTFKDYGIAKEKLILMPFGIEADSIRKEIASKERKEFKVGFIGSIGLRKGIRYLMEAVREIDNPNIKLYIAGSFQAKGNILQEYRGYYNLMGYLSPSKKEGFISDLDVLVLPSLIDSFGIVILEAMAKGIAVIASENTGGPDIINNGNDGFIVPIRNTEAIKEKILYLYNNRQKRVDMGRKALEKVSNFTWDRYADRYKNFIETIKF